MRQSAWWKLWAGTRYAAIITKILPHVILQKGGMDAKMSPLLAWVIGFPSVHLCASLCLGAQRLQCVPWTHCLLTCLLACLLAIFSGKPTEEDQLTLEKNQEAWKRFQFFYQLEYCLFNLEMINYHKKCSKKLSKSFQTIFGSFFSQILIHDIHHIFLWVAGAAISGSRHLAASRLPALSCFI